MHNPFESLELRLDKIEALLTRLTETQIYSIASRNEENRYGNFDWYITETGEAQSTARQRIAKGEVPGVIKLGKRLLFDKALVRSWLADNQRMVTTQLTQAADDQFNQRHATNHYKGKTR